MLVVTKVVQTCGSCPSQWEGETGDGRFVYARYRSGRLRVGVGITDVRAVEAAMRDATINEQLGDNLDGTLSFEDLKRATACAFEWPETCG